MAQYFENSTAKSGRLVTGNIDCRRLGLARAWIVSRNAPSAGELMAMDRATFYANANATYPMSWALVTYLMTQRSGTFHRYLQDLKWNRDVRRFGRDSPQWQSDFEHFI